MSINLQKGQRIDLTKGNAGLSKILVGLGWDEAKSSAAPSKGMLGGLFGGGGSSSAPFDCDASVLMLNENGKLAGKESLVYFGNLKSKCGSIQHTGDNLTGAGDGDDEQVIINLTQVPSDIHKIVFVVNIYDCKARKQDFGMISNAFIRVANTANNQELLKFNLSENYSGLTSLFVGEIYRNNSEWKFAAIGDGTNDSGLKEIVAKYT